MKKKSIYYKLIVTGILGVYVVIAVVFSIKCPIWTITGIHCLGCGMTRAVASALRLDFATAFSHHIMFWSLPLLYFCFLKDGKLFKNKILNIVFYGLILVGFVLNWIMRL